MTTATIDAHDVEAQDDDEAPPIVSGIQLPQDLAFTRRDWRAQHIGQVGMALVVAAALAGALGRGPLAHARAEAPGLGVAYERVVRHGAGAELSIDVDPALATDGVVQIAVDGDYLETMQIDQLAPEPERVVVDGERLVADVAVAPGERGRVRIDLTPRGMGPKRAEISVVGGGSVQLKQLVLP
jgi:hypothetical protein